MVRAQWAGIAAQLLLCSATAQDTISSLEKQAGFMALGDGFR